MSPKAKSLIVVGDIVLFFLLLNFLPFEPLENKGLALLLFVGILWLTEAVHVTITAISIPILAAMMGLVTTNKALNGFSDPNIYLFFGGFALAAAMHYQKIDRIIAQRILAMARGNFLMSVVFLFTVTAFLSMWMSNTATAAMMLPLALGILSKVDPQENKSVFTFVMLGIAYSASIGGMGTLVGSPPNAIVASNMDMTFADWFVIGFPFMLVLMPVMLVCLYFVFRPNLKIEVDFKDDKVEFNGQRYLTLAVFVIVALCWIFSAQINPFLSGLFGLAEKIASFDSVIAIAAAIVVVVLKLISWKDVQENTDWGVLMLFGGGITLSAVLKDSGASKIMADGIVFLVQGQHYFVIGLLVSFFIVFLTEFTSNTASAALLVPLFITIAESIGAPPLGLSLIIGLGASCAFMLPVATPPNAIVFGTGYVKQQDMVRVGLVLNIVCSIVIAVGAYFFFL
ncbi:MULTISPECIES: DASS family sodium-coupled anion symporter [unclassified Anaerobiospirillum]|uniref:SLC13 family permease n=1 Tax=unclassified Anaerobiospirillum TaxID=2647410 RepID=UPI001FF61BCD|nr:MULTISPECIES: DASS family sodium-coupled anion symporter [unclassified Anaerobiospirillum]MCK0533694.1 DASS family sodium-coupled anion symporter [Anaerobiospirillum sp. NML120511]MCK0539657.1 DASS family sodium-coupled anion symporter [Anaerobiospirillum sp. NML02-A-032]